eukprot:GEMP01023975.1.p1 GENE.GEMP01023975.1~~GEMP01023975.1.p1  ORF type:complete len:594 (+),score=126.32 GEMP01023975.1:164-1945(+)
MNLTCCCEVQQTSENEEPLGSRRAGEFTSITLTTDGKINEGKINEGDAFPALYENRAAAPTAVLTTAGQVADEVRTATLANMLTDVSTVQKQEHQQDEHHCTDTGTEAQVLADVSTVQKQDLSTVQTQDLSTVQTQDGSLLQTQEQRDEHHHEAVTVAPHVTADKGDSGAIAVGISDAAKKAARRKSSSTVSSSSSKSTKKTRDSISSISALKRGAVCFLRDLAPSFSVMHHELDISLLLTKSHNGTVQCVENACPHTTRTKLSAGDIEDINGRQCVVCPRHRARFHGGFCVDLETGACMSHDGKPLAYQATTFGCRVKDGQVFVDQPNNPLVSKRSSSASIDDSPIPTKRRSSLADRMGDSGLDLWKMGKIKSKRWITLNLIELKIDIPHLAIPKSGFWHYCIEYQGIEREYTPVPGSVTGLAILWIRIYAKGVFSKVIKKARAGQEVRVQIEDTLPDSTVHPVAIIGAGTGALEAFHDLSIPHLGSFRCDKDFDVFENLGFKVARVTGELPPQPLEPECCDQGCDPCVLDKYDRLVLEYAKYQERRRGRIEAADLELLPDGPIFVCGPVGFIQHIEELVKGTKKTVIALEG